MDGMGIFLFWQSERIWLATVGVGFIYTQKMLWNVFLFQLKVIDMRCNLYIVSEWGACHYLPMLRF